MTGAQQTTKLRPEPIPRARATVRVVKRFDSYHWQGASTGTPELETARARLAEAWDVSAFERLLHSESPVAVGIAFDHFHRATAFERHGGPSPDEALREAVLRRARAVLRDEPFLHGANHASALGALMNHATPADAPLFISALARSPTSNVRLAASLAAPGALGDSALVHALGRIALDEGAGHDERAGALSVLSEVESVEVTELLRSLLSATDQQLQATAALALLDRDFAAYRLQVEVVARAWPVDLPSPAAEVLERLDPPSG